jgi:hypothetical protein
MKKLISYEEFMDWLPVVMVTLVIILALVGLAIGIETVRANIWAAAIRNTGCSCPVPSP